MNRNLLGGAALVAMMAATPALAQDDNLCVLSDLDDARVMDERISQLDTDGDGSITLTEYEECLDTNQVADADREAALADFEELDTDADAILLVAEIEAGMADAEMTDAAASDAEAAQVEVQQPTAQVEVEQPAPEVEVEAADPTVRVQQPEPDVAVEQAEPQVEVQQREPEVTVQQPEPTVEVEQPEAEVAVQQPEPQVEVDAPAPEVEVRQAQPEVAVEQVQPQVSVEQPEPQVDVQQAEAEVEVQTAEPEVQIEQGEPEVVIERVTDVEDAEVEQTEAAEMDADATEMEAEADMEVAAVEAETEEVAAVEDDPVDVGAGLSLGRPLEGEAVYNNAGEEFGDIEEIVMETETGEMYAVIAAGGFLGIGDNEIVFPMSALSVVDDRVIVDTNLSEDRLEDMEGYDESRFEEVPDDQAVR